LAGRHLGLRKFPNTVHAYSGRILGEMNVRQREFWNGPPERLPDSFTMTKPKGDHALTATCEVWTNPFAWELRLMIDGHGMQMTSVVRSAVEMLDMVEEWKTAMRGKGWS
jgi:hypothetical protein